MGDTLKGESNQEEKEKIDRRLEALATQFSDLQQTADARMKGAVYNTMGEVYCDP